MRRVCLFTVLLPLVFGQDAKKDPDQIGTRDVSKGINFYSIEKEMALGKGMSQQVERDAKLVTDKLITEYVNRLGQNLARHSDTKIPLTIKVIEGDDPNAVTLPGGFIYVHLGLIRTADGEAELAGAMAHEIAHVAARHGTRQATQSQITQVATIPLIFLGGWGGLCARGASSLIFPAGSLAVQRGYETEADMLGLQYVYKSGYDPLGMVDMFEKIFSLEDRKQGKLVKLTADHPASDNRLVAVQKNIEKMLKPLPEYIVNTSEFDKIKAHLAALDWIPKPEPTGPKPPTLKRPGDQIANVKKLVPGSDTRASHIKDYTVR